MWSQPSGGATVTSYIVHYNDGAPETSGALSALLTSYDIERLARGAMLTISVEATSQHLSGESEEMPFTLRMF